MRSLALTAAFAGLALAGPANARAQSPHARRVHVAAIGALTGVVRSFGENSRAALRAAADSINRAGGVRLADGARARIEVTYVDARCDAEEGIALVRHFAASDALLVVGPSCSGAAEPLYQALQRRADVDADTGLRIPVFTDGAAKAQLARISEWAFRNVPDERAMYRTTWAWLRRRRPELTTVFGGEERDFPHSHSTWSGIIRPEAVAAGFRIVAEQGWSIADTAFGDVVRAMAKARPDVVVLSAHSTTTCGVLREMRRQGVRPRAIIGLTSASSDVTLRLCGDVADGLLIPTSFAPVTPAARAAARAIARAGGVADLHSVAAWEILFAVARALESAGVRGEPATIGADRRRLRDALAHLESMDGALGSVWECASEHQANHAENDPGAVSHGELVGPL
ncbi:MAG: ABC transporter substrate-binding protein, partial [Gemmatimonadaceae bacterium]|nr:ABC transporter substrate-binding protein [Gemmatimonadaceae bacterium]